MLGRFTQDVKIEDISLDVDYEAMYILFLPEQKEKFDNVLALIEGNETLFVSDLKVFAKFKEAVRAVSHKDNIRNISSIVSKMCDIVKEHYRAQKT